MHYTGPPQTVNVPHVLLSSRGSALSEQLASGERIPVGGLAGIRRAASEASKGICSTGVETLVALILRTAVMHGGL